jgi:uncharacterized protein (TIGR02246 family)
MSHVSMIFAASLLAGIGLATSAFAQGNVTKNNPADEAAIRSVMADYNAALNGGKTAAVLPLYADDGIFMPPYSQSAVGKDAVQIAYDKVFDELKFNVKFTIAELVQMAPTWAYVRTNSAGMTGHASTGKTTAEANQELFIFRKGDDGKWRIARYSFSPTNPPSN